MFTSIILYSSSDMLYLSMKLFLIMFNASNASSLCCNTSGQRCNVLKLRIVSELLTKLPRLFDPKCVTCPSKASKTAAPTSRYVNVTTISDNVRTLRRFIVTKQNPNLLVSSQKKAMYTVTCHWHVSSILRKAMYIITFYRHSRKLKYVSSKELFKTTMCIQQTVIQFIK